MNTRDIVPGDRIFALFKGDPKTGKSCAAASFPRPYILDTDGRIRSVAKMFPSKDVEYDTFIDFWDVCIKLQALVQRCDYQTVVVSSLTSLANLAIEYSLKFRGVSDSDEQKRKSELKRGNLALTEVSDWGVEFRGLSKVLDCLKALPCHVILEAHVLEVTRENIMKGTTTISRSLMTGGKKIAAYLPTAFDEAYHFYVDSPMSPGERPRFKVATVHMGDDWAGTVLPLPPIIDWTHRNLYEVIQSYLRNPYVPGLPEGAKIGVIP